MQPRMTVVMDTPTYLRDVEHDHFRPGESVLIITGSQNGSLTGIQFTIVASSWHATTGTNGWRLRNKNGGELSFVTAAPKYLIHTDQHCAYCVEFLGQLNRWILPVLPRNGVGYTNSYSLADGELLHIADEISAAGS